MKQIVTKKGKSQNRWENRESDSRHEPGSTK